MRLREGDGIMTTVLPVPIIERVLKDTTDGVKLGFVGDVDVVGVLVP